LFSGGFIVIAFENGGGGTFIFLSICPLNKDNISFYDFTTFGLKGGGGGMYPGGLIVIALLKGGGGTFFILLLMWPFKRSRICC